MTDAWKVVAIAGFFLFLCVIAMNKAHSQTPHQQFVAMVFNEGPARVVVTSWPTETYELSVRASVMHENAKIKLVVMKIGTKEMARCVPPADGFCTFVRPKTMALHEELAVTYTTDTNKTFTQRSILRRPNTAVAP